jgi:type VI secretion system protein ImpG
MDELLPHYNRELEFLRRQAGEFAAAFPKVAGRLRLSAETADDPHVERMIEAVALLNARIRLKLEDEFPEIVESLLHALYPHFLAPTPSMGVVQLRPSPDLAEPWVVPRGAMIETEPVGGEPCRYRTGAEVRVWPIEVAQATLSGRPFRAPAPPPGAQGAVAVLHVRLRATAPGLSFAELQPDNLRLFLPGPTNRSLPLHGLLTSRLLGLAVATGLDDPDCVHLPPAAVQPAGFAEHEALLPWPSRSLPAYRWLTEYFAFTDRFLFVDVSGLTARAVRGAGSELDLYFYLAETDRDLERAVDAAGFALGAVPVVNLFPQAADPFRLSGAQLDYRIVPDSRRPEALEIFSVQSVEAVSPDGREARAFLPFFGLDHGGPAATRYWYAARRPSSVARDRGSELFLSVVDRGASPAAPADWTASVETLCMNRDLPARLPFGGGHPRLSLSEPASQVRDVTALTAFTPTRRRPPGAARLWPLLSHLNLNHLSISDGSDGAAGLREVLRLYDVADAAETRAVIDSVLKTASRRGIARVQTPLGAAVVHGTEIDVTLDAQGFPQGGALLFAGVLDRVLGLFAALNAFSRLTVRIEGRSGVLRRFPARVGLKPLL